MDISVLEFTNIFIFINYSKFKDIFNLYIKISLMVYEMIISIRFEKTLKFIFYDLYKIIG